MKEKKEKSELEEVIKEVEEEIELKEIAEEISENEPEENLEEFNEFIEPVQIPRNSPSLERINISPQTSIRLEQGLPSSSENEKEDSFKYGFTSSEEDEPKYSNQSPETLMPKSTQIENLGREDFSQPQSVGFIQSNEIPQTNEEYIKPSFENIENLGRNEDTLERKEIKYKPTH